MKLYIDDFKCTDLGKTSIVEKDPSLSDKEIQILYTICEYEYATNRQVKELEEKFNAIYQDVDMTRLVVNRYLTVCQPSNINKRIARKVIAYPLQSDAYEQEFGYNETVPETSDQDDSVQNISAQNPIEQDAIGLDTMTTQTQADTQTDTTAQSKAPKSSQVQDPDVDPILRFAAGSFSDN